MHILSKNPEMGKGQAFAIATQQSHATGHTPKSYGTSSAKQEAKQKYDDPKSTYESTADPGRVGKKLEKAEDRGDVKIKQAYKKAVINALKRIQPDDVARAYQVSRSNKKKIKEAGLLARGIEEAGDAMMGTGAGLLGARGIRKYRTNKHQSAAAMEKAAGRIGALVGSLVAPEQSKQIQELRTEIDALKSTLPKPQAEQVKKASSMLSSSLDVVMLGGFSDELQKIAGLPGTPTGLTEIKSTIPTKPLSGKTPKYSKVNADPSESPMTGTQPISDPPPTRA